MRVAVGRPSARAGLVAVAVRGARRARRDAAPARRSRRRYWIDEGISVGIAAHPLSAIPGVLRQDGSPPLYYLLLHVWMAFFGSAPGRDPRALRRLRHRACRPRSGRWRPRRGGRPRRRRDDGARPFMGLYADETRMYSLLLLLGVLVCGAFLRAFVLRRRARVRELRADPRAAALLARVGRVPRPRPRGWLARARRAGPNRRTLVRDGAARLRRGRAAVRAMGADAALPGRPHRRARGRTGRTGRRWSAR